MYFVYQLLDDRLFLLHQPPQLLRLLPLRLDVERICLLPSQRIIALLASSPLLRLHTLLQPLPLKHALLEERFARLVLSNIMRRLALKVSRNSLRHFGSLLMRRSLALSINFLQF